MVQQVDWPGKRIWWGVDGRDDNTVFVLALNRKEAREMGRAELDPVPITGAYILDESVRARRRKEHEVQMEKKRRQIKTVVYSGPHRVGDGPYRVRVFNKYGAVILETRVSQVFRGILFANENYPGYRYEVKPR